MMPTLFKALLSLERMQLNIPDKNTPKFCGESASGKQNIGSHLMNSICGAKNHWNVTHLLPPLKYQRCISVRPLTLKRMIQFFFL